MKYKKCRYCPNMILARERSLVCREKVCRNKRQRQKYADNEGGYADTHRKVSLAYYTKNKDDINNFRRKYRPSRSLLPRGRGQ